VSAEIRKCSFASKILTLSDPESTTVQVRTLKRMKERIEAKKNKGMRRKMLEG
jgi:hypothetical protein